MLRPLLLASLLTGVFSTSMISAANAADVSLCKVATIYPEYLYSPEGQDIAGKHCYPPIDKKVAAKYAKQFTLVKLVSIDEVFGGWQKAQKTHFDDGGSFEQISVR